MQLAQIREIFSLKSFVVYGNTRAEFDSDPCLIEFVVAWISQNCHITLTTQFSATWFAVMTLCFGVSFKYDSCCCMEYGVKEWHKVFSTSLLASLVDSVLASWLIWAMTNGIDSCRFDSLSDVFHLCMYGSLATQLELCFRSHKHAISVVNFACRVEWVYSRQLLGHRYTVYIAKYLFLHLLLQSLLLPILSILFIITMSMFTKLHKSI